MVEHSTDNGKTWQAVEPGPRSIVGWHVGQSREGSWDDGHGNLYRWRPDGD